MIIVTITGWRQHLCVHGKHSVPLTFIPERHVFQDGQYASRSAFAITPRGGLGAARDPRYDDREGHDDGQRETRCVFTRGNFNSSNSLAHVCVARVTLQSIRTERLIRPREVYQCNVRSRVDSG